MCRDLPLLHDAATVNASFNALPKEANGFPANRTLQDFIAANFGTAGSDFESALPDDFSSEPEDFLTNVTDPAIRQWALQVNDLWQDLCREVFLLTIHPVCFCIMSCLLTASKVAALSSVRGVVLLQAASKAALLSQSMESGIAQFMARLGIVDCMLLH